VIKMVFMLKRRPGMSREDFVAYYEANHARLAEPYVTKAARYVRRYLSPEASPFSQPADEFDVLTELWFDDEAAMQATMAKLAEPDVQSAIEADEEKLFDRPRSRVYTVTEQDSTQA
jgi:uncharacterized protein (TIGR02118 family)